MYNAATNKVVNLNINCYTKIIFGIFVVVMNMYFWLFTVQALRYQHLVCVCVCCVVLCCVVFVCVCVCSGVCVCVLWCVCVCFVCVCCA